jgi:HSP20 family protein
MDPWSEMENMRRRMDDLFSSFFGPGLALPGSQWLSEQGGGPEPDVDVFENDQEYIVHAALPGFKPEDIHVEATNDSIRLSAEYRSPWDENRPENAGQGEGADAQNLKQHRQSRFSRQGSFQFNYSFPQELRAEDVRADFNNGRLELHLPKAQPDSSANRPRQIPVTTGGTSTGAPQLTSSKGGGATAPPGKQQTEQKPSTPAKKAA